MAPRQRKIRKHQSRSAPRATLSRGRIGRQQTSRHALCTAGGLCFLQKQSADTVITSGNNTYQFTGATFDIFESASGARVGTIKMDSNGRAQATLLPDTAYYLVETKAPAGYVPRHDRIAFTTGNDGGRVAIDEQPGTINLRIVKLDAATNAGPRWDLHCRSRVHVCVAINPWMGANSHD